MSATVVIVGRPNVGKSTLFNRLAGRRLALVHDRPGVTRDRRQGEASLGELEFTIVDTAGFEEATGESLEARMRQQTEQAIAAGDVCLLLIDARAGLTAVDREFAEIVRRSGKPVIVCANKAEGRAGEAGLYEAFELGLGGPVAISAAHGDGMDELYEALKLLLPPPSQEAEQEEESRPLRLAIVGRPNVGKSTLINALLGEERMLTGPEAGITRDAISMDWSWRGRPIKLWDTAGMRRRARIDEPLEKMAVQDGLRAAKFAEVVVLVLDACHPFEKQDLQLADLIEREGRALVIAVNKWDLVDEAKTRRLKELQADLNQMLPQLAGVPLVTVSAVEGRGLGRMMEAVFEVYELWNKRIGTGELNRWLEYQVERHPPPAPGGRRIKLRYMTQVSARPPNFAVFSTRGSELPEAYKRYLVNALRADFGLKGIPIRLNLRERKNPYAPD